MTDERDERGESGTPGAAAAEDGDASRGTEENGTVERIREALGRVADPELGVNIVDLGLVYDIEVEGDFARITMTLTSPGCPAGEQILGGAQKEAESVEEIDEAEINLVWKPFWTPDRMDPKVRAAMGY